MQPNKGIDGFYLVRQRSSKAQARTFLLTRFVVRVQGMVLNIYLTSRSRFVRQNHRSMSFTFVKFSLAAVHTTNFPCPKPGMTSFAARLLGKEKLSICCPYTRANKTCQGKLVKETFFARLYAA